MPTLHPVRESGENSSARSRDLQRRRRFLALQSV